MKESVIFVLRMGESVLCERRSFNGGVRDCILGGGIEPGDRRHADHVLAAVRRETGEELGITAGPCETIGDFLSEGIRFHVVAVKSWTGPLPAVNRDNQNELRWVPLAELIAGTTLVPLRDLMTKALDAQSS